MNKYDICEFRLGSLSLVGVTEKSLGNSNVVRKANTTEPSLSTRHCSKPFTCADSCHPYANTERQDTTFTSIHYKGNIDR
jgi:hypothetical protein